MSTALPPAAPDDDSFPRSRRFIFVQLLFSLTAAEIARQSAEIFLQSRGFWEPLPIYAHLFLATAVVTTSWLGWSHSEASLKIRMRSAFSWPFLVLLVDVFLVIMYFILVRSAEIPKAEKSVEPSAEDEAWMIAAIFIGYFAWDVLTKAIMVEGVTQTALNVLKNLCGRVFWRRGWASASCMVLAVVGGLLLHSSSSYYGVLSVDLCFISLVLLFRAFKERRWRWAGGLLIATLVFGVIAYCLSQPDANIPPACP